MFSPMAHSLCQDLKNLCQIQITTKNIYSQSTKNMPGDFWREHKDKTSLFFGFASLLFSSRLCSNLFYSSLLCYTCLQSFPFRSSMLFSTLLCIVSFTLLFYCSLFSVTSSYWAVIRKSDFYLKKIHKSQKQVCPGKMIDKYMPQTTASSSKNDMYLMNFPSRHTGTAAQDDNRGTSCHPDPVVRKAWIIVKLINWLVVQ